MLRVKVRISHQSLYPPEMPEGRGNVKKKRNVKSLLKEVSNEEAIMINDK